MATKRFLSGAAAAALTVFAHAAPAAAQEAPTLGCPITELTANEAGQLYLQAETELIANQNPAKAVQLLNQMRALDLNCFEQGAALRLSAGAKIQNDDYRGAISDLQSALDQGFVPETEREQTIFNIAQLYLTIEDLPNARMRFREWLQLGGQPNRDQMWTLAVLNTKLDDNEKALEWAEKVFAIDGPNAKREVYDFLIFLYDQTGNLAKKAELLEALLVRDPTDRRLWDAISGDYFQAGDERKAFEVQKAMYLGGILQTEDEIMRVVNFYNQFNAPYEAARVLDTEISNGRIEGDFEKLELLANLYQVAREYERAIPVIRRAAELNNSGEMYERLGRSYAELQDWENTETALLRAIEIGGLKDRGLAWVLIGQSRFERNDRDGAREAFRNANNRGGRGWIDFMRSEDRTAFALNVFEKQQEVTEYRNEKQACDRLSLLGGENLPAGCATVAERLTVAEEELAELQRQLNAI